VAVAVAVLGSVVVVAAAAFPTPATPLFHQAPQFALLWVRAALALETLETPPLLCGHS
jgi:hypothetical protein